MTTEAEQGSNGDHTRMSDTSKVSHFAAQTAEGTHEHPRNGTRRNAATTPTIRSRRSGDRGDPPSPTTIRRWTTSTQLAAPAAALAHLRHTQLPKVCTFHHMKETRDRDLSCRAPKISATRAIHERRAMPRIHWTLPNQAAAGNHIHDHRPDPAAAGNPIHDHRPICEEPHQQG